MKTLLGTVAAHAPLGAPAFAQDATMDYSTTTCTDVLAVDSAGMMAAQEGLTAAMGSDTVWADGAAADTMAADSATTGTMASDDTMATHGVATDVMAADDAATADGSMGAEDMASHDPTMVAFQEACTADQSMMAMDAMTTSQTH